MVNGLDDLIRLAHEKCGKVVDERQQPAYCLWDLAWVVMHNDDWCAKLVWVRDTEHLYRLHDHQQGRFRLVIALDVPRPDFERDGRVQSALERIR